MEINQQDSMEQTQALTYQSQQEAVAEEELLTQLRGMVEQEEMVAQEEELELVELME